MKKLLIMIGIVALSSSCVSTRKYDAARAEALRLDNDLTALQERYDRLTELNRELNEDKLSLQSQLTSSQGEAAELARQKEQTEKRLAALEQQQAELNEMLDRGNDETKRMLEELQHNQADLEERSQRIEELESLLKARDEAIAAIRRQVSDALLGFEGKGLTISTRDGKVYVSMEDKLLFRSGSYQIGPEGERAVRDLSNVLAANPDINVMVEGHTDNVPYTPNAYLKDNLDLSAKRATTVVRLLLENKGIAPERIIAAGRGESVPVAEGDSAEARAKNRRTEIVLTPKYDELLELMNK